MARAFFGTAMVLAAVDLAHKAAAGTGNMHTRSGFYVAVVVVLAAAWTAAILASRSRSIAFGGAVVAGGALGNLASVAIWPGVPNPIALGLVAFNVADVLVVGGFVFVAVAVLALAARSPDRLREPITLVSWRFVRGSR
jgi:lipoprotein signal peptidase